LIHLLRYGTKTGQLLLLGLFFSGTIIPLGLSIFTKVRLMKLVATILILFIASAVFPQAMDIEYNCNIPTYLSNSGYDIWVEELKKCINR